MKILKYVLCLVFCVLMMSSEIVFSADPSTNDAQKRLQVFLDEMMTLVKQGQGQPVGAMTDKLYGRAIQEFDFTTFSMLSLGKKYQEFSRNQREEFEQSFSQLIAKTYVSRLEGKNINQVSLEYLDPVVLKPRKNLLRIDVPTNLIHDNISTPVTYRMIKQGEQDWKIYDVIIEGVTMTANYREQFRNYVSDPPEKIIADLQEKLEELEK